MIPREPSRSGPPTQTRQVTIGVVSETGYSREALVKCLAQRSQTIAVDLGCGDRETFDRVSHLRPQIVLLDLLHMPGSELARELLRISPDTHVVALGVSEVEAEVLPLAEAGVAGFIPREASLDHLFTAIENALRSQLTCSPRIAGALLKRLASLSSTRGPDREDVQLTGRERQIIRMLEDGLSNKEIAERLRIGAGTVKTHVHHILEKLAVHHRGEAAARAERATKLRLFRA